MGAGVTSRGGVYFFLHGCPWGRKVTRRHNATARRSSNARRSPSTAARRCRSGTRSAWSSCCGPRAYAKARGSGGDARLARAPLDQGIWRPSGDAGAVGAKNAHANNDDEPRAHPPLPPPLVVVAVNAGGLGMRYITMSKFAAVVRNQGVLLRIGSAIVVAQDFQQEEWWKRLAHQRVAAALEEEEEAPVAADASRSWQ